MSILNQRAVRRADRRRPLRAWPARTLPSLTAGLALALLLGACAEKSEAEQLAELRDSLTYSQYRRLSEQGLPGALAAYSAGVRWSEQSRTVPPGKLPELTDAHLCVLHLMLAYGALSADKTTLALAETDIVEAQQCQAFDDLAAASLRSVVYHRLQWAQLAQAESERVWAAPRVAGAERGPAEQMIALHLGLGYLAITEKRWDRAQVHIDALARQFDLPWLSELGQVGGALHEGRPKDALVGLKRLSEDPTVPPELRTELLGFIAQVEAKGGDVDSFAFMPRLFVVLTWDAVRDYGPDLLRWGVGFADYEGKRQLAQSLEQSQAKAREAANSWWQQARRALGEFSGGESGQAADGATATEAPAEKRSRRDD